MSSITEQISTLSELGKEAKFSITEFGRIGEWPLIGMNRLAEQPEASHIYLSSGIHGDEPAGPQAIIELLEEDSLPRTLSFWICPILNPAGINVGTRQNAQGVDLNRDYRKRASEEIRAHCNWIESNIPEMEIGLHLHEDWESTGFYLYEENRFHRHSHAQAMLAAASAHVPIDPAPEIDGWPAEDGFIDVADLPQNQVGDAESGYLRQRFGSQNYTIEAPSSLELPNRVNALKASVRAVIDQLSTK